MKLLFLLFVVALLVASCIMPPGEKKETVHAPDSSESANAIVDAQLNITLSPPKVAVQNKEIPHFTKGLNLGNALDAPAIGEWGVMLDELHFKYAKEGGFDHVRFPVRFSAHAQSEAPYVIDEAFFKIVDWGLDEAEKNGLGVLLDVHHYEELMKTPEQHKERYLTLWKQIAERYQNRPETVAFELLNEPCDQLKIEILNPLMKEAHELVRRSNPNRLLFVDSYFWANTEWLDDMDVSFFDTNTIATFHMYQPILFTHQGAPWMDPEYRVAKVIFPGPPKTPVPITGAAKAAEWANEWLTQYNTLPADTNPSGPKTIWEEFDRATAFVKETGHRVYLGEFGAIDYADSRSRTIFLKMVRTEAERRGIGWAIWDDGGKNKVLDIQSGTWTEAVYDALFD
ncbi:MAG: cellulase family glycosylhydrolase [Deltaproteobacteria bacterium]|nr:cellulase family glycosylhydrolase [Deltaproteobacteria bacterium]MBN2671672.1 cellulase family glycosylhydrolase [Deltaproteobacteria bacterium]